MYLVPRIGLAQAPKTSLPNRILNKCIQLYLDSTEVNTEDHGVFVIEFLTIERIKVEDRFTLENKMRGIVQVQFTYSEFTFRKIPAYIYSGSAPAVVYFGIESYADYKEPDLQKFRNQLRHRFIENSAKAYPIIKYRIDLDSVSRVR